MTAARCPRCGGALFTARDAYGAYRSCLACGFVQELLSGPAIDVPLDEVGRRLRQPQPGRSNKLNRIGRQK